MNISNRDKFYIYERDKRRCFYCKKDLKYRQITLDHYFPKSKGGTKEIFNLVLSCKKCNRLKGNKIPINYEEIIIIMFKKAYIDGMIKCTKLIVSNLELKKEIFKVNRIESIKPNFVFQSNNMRFYIIDNTIEKIVFLGG
ncbi:MAG: HNH endonuclease [Tissierellia bacterium]|nr:HNH endonuclease [Tissierellia bacterium]